MMQVLVGFNSGGMPTRFLASNTHSSRSLKSSAKKTSLPGTDCGLGGRVHPQIAWAKLRTLRDGAAIAKQEIVELNSNSVRDERNKKQESLK
jgi:hypothetical protein